jgi:two-component system, LytTR family, response regulator
VSFRIAIVDDEAPARDRLSHLLAGRAGVTIAASCDSGAAAVAALRGQPIDLVFLDIEMPEVDGFGVIEAVGPARMPPVVFVTAHDEHAVRAFELRALDYLLKPVDRARFEATFARFVTTTRPRWLERLLIPERDRIELVETADIDWIGSAGNYAEIHADGRTLLLRATLTELEQRLDPQRFVRIHRDTIVQLARLTGFERLPGGQLRALLRDGLSRAVGRSHRPHLEAVLGRL